MGGNKFQDIFKNLEKKAEQLMDSDSEADDEILKEIRKNNPQTIADGEDYECTFQSSVNPTRWEKAVVALHGMVKQVSKVDPDGMDIVCFGGSEDKRGKISLYRKVKNIKDIEAMVTSKLPSGPCHMGRAMDFVLKEAFDRGFERPCGILVLTAGIPDDSERLEKTLQVAAEKIAAKGYKESPLSVTFVHVGDDKEAEDYMQHLDKNMKSHKKSRKTRKVVDIVDCIKDSEIKAAMAEIKGTKSSGTTGAIVGAFAGAAMGVGGMYMYNKNQAKKRTEGWNGHWRATYGGCEIATLKVKDDLKGNLKIEGFSGGKTVGKYAERQYGYNITFRDADEGWKITGDIEDEHNIFWSDGTKWEEIPHKGAKFGHYAGAAAAGAATGGAVGYLLDKKFFKKAHKKDQADYVILVDRSKQMAVKDRSALTLSGTDDEYDFVEEYKPDVAETEEDDSGGDGDGGLISTATKKFEGLSTEQKVAVGVAGAAAVAGVAAAGVGVAHAVKAHKSKNDGDDGAPVVQARAVGASGSVPGRAPAGVNQGLTGRWRATFEGDELASLVVKDDLDGILTISGFFAGKTIGRYTRNSVQRIVKIHFIDADENWAVHGEVKGGDSESVIIWKDGTRWDKIF
ncbi:unnamed protein product [Pseudo-nitzschia multistriata]|uniref:VWFA domain-containing protein n=1 Tax=Pseudo-nitzschia multistriata TaxID=183589 RepID=A0A448ZPX2_9STRA|nr:unnamed protein product [Pseudo-nitzschia multistriata]